MARRMEVGRHPRAAHRRPRRPPYLFARREDISAAFPDILAAMDFHAVLDGELLVVRDGAIAPFAELQQRLNRKTVTAKMQRDHPAAVRLYDQLFDAQEDLRALPFDARRARLEAWHARTTPDRMDLSPWCPSRMSTPCRASAMAPAPPRSRG